MMARRAEVMEEEIIERSAMIDMDEDD